MFQPVRKAFLNWMVVGEDFNAATSLFPNHVGALQIPTINTGDTAKQIVGPANMVIRRNGWIYIYLSNESNQSVYFDNLTVNLKHGPLVEQKDYYAFGMENPALSTKAIKFNYNENRIKFNGKELQRKEFLDTSGLEWEDAGSEGDQYHKYAHMLFHSKDQFFQPRKVTPIRLFPDLRVNMYAARHGRCRCDSRRLGCDFFSNEKNLITDQ